MRTQATTCRVMLVDDHAVVRTGYRTLLNESESIEIVGEAESGEEAYIKALELTPDVIVMDISLPGLSGIEATRKITTRMTDARVLMFSMHEGTAFVEQALQAGALGYISKSSDPEVLIQAIKTIANGEKFLDERIAGQLGNQASRTDKEAFDDFSTREFEIFCLLAKGATTARIAETLCISGKTVANYTTQVKAKLNVANNAELVHVALRNGIISAGTDQ